MSLLSLYSRIQLKIGKAEEKLRWLHSGDSPVEPECKTSQKGSTALPTGQAALKGLWSQRLLLSATILFANIKNFRRGLGFIVRRRLRGF